MMATSMSGSRTCFKSWIGDANVDGPFASDDLISVFTTGKYELDVPTRRAAHPVLGVHLTLEPTRVGDIDLSDFVQIQTCRRLDINLPQLRKSGYLQRSDPPLRLAAVRSSWRTMHPRAGGQGRHSQAVHHTAARGPAGQASYEPHALRSSCSQPLRIPHHCGPNGLLHLPGNSSDDALHCPFALSDAATTTWLPPLASKGRVAEPLPHPSVSWWK